MARLVHRGLVLLALGLLARPAWALGNQLDVFIYWALGLVGLLGVVGLVLLGRLLRALFSSRPRPEPTGRFGQVTLPSRKEAVFFLALGLAMLAGFLLGR